VEVARQKFNHRRTQTERLSATGPALSQDEIDRLCVALGFDEAPVSTKSSAVAVAFLFGEICGLKRSDMKGSVAHLPRTKNGTKRDVPLSSPFES
jgi:integrase